MFAHNQSSGTTPVSMDSWNNMERAGLISSAVVCKTHGEMSSGPAALCGFKFLSNLLTPSSRIMMSGIDGISLSLSVGKSDSLSCVNWDWYCIFNSSAFPLLSVTSSLLCESFSAGIPVESFFRDLMKLQNCFTEARLLFLMNFLYRPTCVHDKYLQIWGEVAHQREIKIVIPYCFSNIS